MPEPRYAIGARVVVTSAITGRFAGRVTDRMWCGESLSACGWRYRVVYQLSHPPLTGVGLSHETVYDEEQIAKAPEPGDPVQMEIPGHVSAIGRVLVVSERLDLYMVFFPTTETGDVMAVPGEWLQIVHPA